METSFDIIICGAGPAGSTCALALGNTGLKVALIDKKGFPRDKICGDAVAPYVPNVLNTIHPSYKTSFEAFREKEIVTTLRVVAPNQKNIDLNFPKEGAISMRVHLDNFLFQHAQQLSNVTTFIGSAVSKVETDNDQAIAVLKNGQVLKAQIIIGCDGAQGIVSKQLTSNKVDLRHNSAAVRAYYRNVKDIPNKTFELHYLKDLMPGYFWIFPLPNGYANVGLGMLSKTVSDRKINLRKELTRIIETTPYLKKRFEAAELIDPPKGYGLPLGSRKVTISGQRFMLCGDAASLIDPLSGEGIGQAIISGRYAGWQAKKCFEQKDFSAKNMKAYNKMVYDKLWKEHKIHYFTQRAIANRPWLINSFANIASKNTFLMRLFQKAFW
ncbi:MULTISPECIES: NAD(P)/FAD-dependent oxidoreductase [unclassified Aureispira]|uniref:NAD(P)/FAD-dependent oxidoreductase n=1 Tax=unclassified Aureispira TaxID=2649989 RepID=UPI0006962946|nr:MULTISPECIES: geranylgeranyl reductase family protein [unclassified Aureispira]WMX17228.1 geranylgeranyl reductase family protein [Aureispira sp. CCB-E]